MEIFDFDDLISRSFDDLNDILHEFNTEKMQSTGIKDKNGKEIFEGDVVKAYEGTYEVVWPEKYITGDNEDIKAWCLNRTDNMTGLRGLDVQSTYEIIGNIYENPELCQ